MFIQGFIISSINGSDYKTYDCEILLPALKVHTRDIEDILSRRKKAQYTHVVFSLKGISFEVPIFVKSTGYKEEIFVDAAAIGKSKGITIDSPLLNNDFVKKSHEDLLIN